MSSDNALIHIYTGDGKGKTTAAIGLCVRAIGAGFRVVMIQFLKAKPSSEVEVLEDIGVQISRCGYADFILPGCPPSEVEIAEARRGLSVAREVLRSDRFDLVVLDEIFCAISCGALTVGEVRKVIEERDPKVELVLTGRDAPEEMMDLADIISEIRSVRHPFDKGIMGRRGIEY